MKQKATHVAEHGHYNFMLNQFLELEGCEVNLVAIDANQDCILIPDLSQVSKIRIVPNIATKPTDWKDDSDWNAVTDNTLTGNTKAKYLKGIGGRPEPSSVQISLPKGKKVTDYKRFRLDFTVFITEEAVFNFLKQMNDWVDFTFWYETVGGKRVGGQNGIKPQNVFSTASIYKPGKNDVENGRLIIEWIADSEAERSVIIPVLGAHLVDDTLSHLVDDSGGFLID